jgi:ribosome-associated protein
VPHFDDQPTPPLANPANAILASPRRTPDGVPLARRRRVLESAELAQRIADLLSDRQAEDIVLMDIGKVSTFTDFFVIATASNPRQMNALIDSLDRDLRPDARPLHVEGTPDSGWVLIDFGDAIVHLFAPEERRYYNLEALWAQGVSVVHIQ